MLVLLSSYQLGVVVPIGLHQLVGGCTGQGYRWFFLFTKGGGVPVVNSSFLEQHRMIHKMSKYLGD